MLRFQAFGKSILFALGAVLLMQGPAEAAGKHAGLRKFLLPKGDERESQIRKFGGKPLAEYGSFVLWGLTDTTKAALVKAAGSRGKGVSERLQLRGGRLQDTRRMGRSLVSAKGRRGKDGGEFQIVQFIGPVRQNWLAQLRATGVRVVSYLPENSYVVWTNTASRPGLDAFGKLDFVQWSGDFLPTWRRAPQLDAVRYSRFSGVDITVQLLDGPGTKASLAKLLAISARVLRRPSRILDYTNISLTVPPEAVDEITAWPDVFNVEPFVPVRKRDEAQGQIMAGNLMAVGGAMVPTGPGYLDWLASKGFPTTPASYPIVDIIDDGIDRGNAAEIGHPDLREFGDSTRPSRVAFLETCTNDALGDGPDGHGNINAGILGGYNDRTVGFPFRDDLGYHYGLGVSPYGRIAGTRIFDVGGAFNVSNCGGGDEGVYRQAWASGARITSNSWGSEAAGAYTSASQAWDAGTRDASATEPGNQEILHVFSAGNTGSGPQTIGAPGTAKNVLTVGATENVRADGVLDGCQNLEANNADDISGFSSRGPTTDGRMKPDIMAPGVHVTGPASQSQGFVGKGVCGVGKLNPFYPPGQNLYTWSSGTSHACPAVSGAAQLVYEYYGRVLKRGHLPSPAMLKALLVNSARYLTGNAAGDDLPSVNQGWGDVNMGGLFDATARFLVDQQVVLRESGETNLSLGQVADFQRGVRVSLVWTDAPGSTVGAAYVNDLDLEVTVAGVTYKGNVFKGALSVTGGVADEKNNIENVFLPAGLAGEVSIRVVAKNIVGDGLPGNADLTDQDFALVASNVTVPPRAVLIADSLVTEKMVGDPATGIEAGDSIEIRVALRNDGDTASGVAAGRLTTSTSGIRLGAVETSYDPILPGGRAWVRYGLRVAPDFPCGASASMLETIVMGADTVRRVFVLVGLHSQVTDTSPTVPVAIRDFDTAVASIETNRVGIVDELKVRVAIAHTYDSDMELTLVSPAGIRVLLASHEGGGGANYNGTTFDDASVLSVMSAVAPFVGVYRPREPLSTFRDENFQGTWKLEILDGVSGDVGTINFFALDATLRGTGCHPNVAPVVAIVDPQRASILGLGDSVMFRATVSDDGKLSSTLSLRWRQLSGPDSLVLSDSAAAVSFARLRTEGTYRLEFTAFDGQWTTADTLEFQVRKPLTAPTGLSSQSLPGAIDLVWDSLAIQGMHYELFRSQMDSLHFQLLTTTSDHHYRDQPLASGTYWYQVASVRDTAVRLGDQMLAAQPGYFSISGLQLVAGSHQVALAWNAPIPLAPGATWTYRVGRSSSAGGPYQYLSTTTATTALDSTLSNGIRYHYAITGVSSGGQGAMSEEDSVTPQAEPLAAPGDLCGWAGSHKVTLRWSPIWSGEGPVEYDVFRRQSQDSAFVLVATVPSDTVFVDSPIPNGEPVSYRIAARNPETMSPLSAIVTTTPQDPPSDLKVLYRVGDANPNDNLIRPLLQIANSGASAVKLSDLTLRYWYANQPSRSQAVWIDWAPMGAANVTGTWHPLATGVAGADGYLEFGFRAAAGVLEAQSSSGEIQARIVRSDWSNHRETGDWSYDPTKTTAAAWEHVTLYQKGVLVWGQEPGVATAPSVPAGLVAQPGNRRVVLSWTGSSQAYNVYRFLPGGLALKVAASVTAGYVDTGLLNGDVYRYVVTGVAGALESLPSATVTATPVGAAPLQVVGVVAVPSSRLVSLNWVPEAEASCYRVLRAKGGTDVVLATTSATSYQDSAVDNDSSYRYTIVASNAWGDAPVSAGVTATPRAVVTGLRARYRAGSLEPITNMIRPYLQLVNTGSTPIALTEVTVRYWFTNEGGMGAGYWCDWTPLGASNVVGVVRATAARPGADRYLELAFRAGAGVLAPGATTGEIQGRMSKLDWSPFTQANDASYGAQSSFSDWSRVTVYRNGVLVWGVEP